MRKSLQKYYPYVIFLVVALLILSPQLTHGFFTSGLDYYFHMSRTYETAMQLKTGHFSYFLSIFSWHQSARVVNAVYGPIGGYISGVILLFAHNWFHWEVTMEIIVLYLAGISMYQLCKYWRVNQVVSLLLSALYMLSPLIFDFVARQAFSGFGAAFIPWVILAGSKLVQHDRIHTIKLALLMTMIAEVHLMTAVLSVMVLVPFVFLAFLTKPHAWKWLGHLLLAAALTLCLSVNVWGAVLEVSGSNSKHILTPYPNVGPMNGNSYNTVMFDTSRPLSSRPSVIGLSVFLVIMVALVLWLHKLMRHHATLNLIMGLGLFYLLLSSKWFPWQHLQHAFPIIDTIIQFPARFLPVGLTAVYLVFGKLVTGHSKVLLGLAIVFLFGTVLWNWRQNDNYIQWQGRIFRSNAVLDWMNMSRAAKVTPGTLRESLLDDHPRKFLDLVYKPAPDYLPTSQSYTRPHQYSKISPYRHVQDQLFTHVYSHLHYHIHLLPHAHEEVIVHSSRHQSALLPFVKYRHTEILKNGHQIEPPISKIGAVFIHLKHGTTRLMFVYHPSHLYYDGMTLSMMAWFLLALWYLFWFGIYLYSLCL